MVFQQWKSLRKYVDTSYDTYLQFYKLRCMPRSPFEQRGYKFIVHERVPGRHFLSTFLHKDLVESNNNTADTLFCSVVILTNLAQPKWTNIHCEKTLLQSVLCQKQHSGQVGKKVRGEQTTLCLQDFIVKNSSCFVFAVTFHQGYKTQKMSVFEGSIGTFQFLFDAVGVEFPPLLSNDVLSAWTYRRYLMYYVYQPMPAKKIQAAGLLVFVTSKVHPFQGGNLHLCGDGTFISSTYQYDGVSDCSASDDEFLSTKHTKVIQKYRTFPCNCSKSPCAWSSTTSYSTSVGNGNQSGTTFRHTFQCSNGENISYKLVNDLVADCESDAEDEGHLLLLLNFAKMFSCPCFEQIQCRASHSKCYNISEICSLRYTDENTISPCRTGDHLQTCKSFECNMMFKCSHSYCIPWSYVCDSKWDCPGGGDEIPNIRCEHNGQCSYLYKCRNASLCVGFHQICDRSKDCVYGDDEYFCELSAIKCPVTCFCHIQVLMCENVTMNENILDQASTYWFVLITHIAVKSEESFADKFVNTRYFHLKNCRVSDICSFASSLKLSTLLDFGFNKVQTLTIGCFKNISTVKTILLNDNRLLTVQRHSFVNLLSLKHINFNNNFLALLSSEILCGKSSLKRLSLKNNTLSHLSLFSFRNLLTESIEADQHFVCCILPEDTQCNISEKWYHNCDNLLQGTPAVASFVTLFCVCLMSNTLFIIAQTTSFLSKSKFEKSLAKCVLVLYAALFVTNLSFTFYFLVMWVANIFYSDSFVLQSTKWKNSYMCYLLLIDLLNFDMISPTLLCFNSFSRLMVVAFPMKTKFKNYSFVCKFVVFSGVFAMICATIAGLMKQSLHSTVPLKFCSPFIDPAKSSNLMKVLTWVLSAYQLTAILFAMMLYFLLHKSLKKSQKDIQKVVTNTRSSSSLGVQTVAFNISHVVSWLPATVVRLNALVQPQFSIAAVMWTRLLASPVNSVVYPVVLTVITLKKS